MKYFLLASFALLTLNLCAQPLKPGKAAKFNTTKVKDSIELKDGGMVYVYQDRSPKVRFMGQLCIATAELAQGDIFKWGFGASADAFFGKFVSLHAEYTKDYVDVLKIFSRNINQNNYNLNDVTGFSSLEGGVRVFLKDEQTHKRHRVILHSRHYGNTTIEYYIAPKLPCRDILALRGGYYSYTSIVTSDMGPGGAVKAKDGTILKDAYFTNAMNTGAYLGIAKLTIFSAVTKNSFKRGGVFLSKAVNELYGDILFVNTSFNSVSDSSGVHKIVANDPGSFKTFPLGVRIGYRKSKENRGIGSKKIEIGYRPGVVGNGFYLNLGFSLALIK